MIAQGRQLSSRLRPSGLAARGTVWPCAAAAQRCRRQALKCQAAQEQQQQRGRDGYDVILSSGFLAFASHCGFLQGVEDAGLSVSGIMGTSAGALTGSFYAAGYSPRQAAAELSRVAPIELLRPSLEPWRGGLLSLDDVINKLRELLPPTFEELQREFAVGVVTAEGEHLLIDSGPLPEAVAASAAIPFVFASVDVPGVAPSLKDGGVVDRIGLKAWRERRRRQQHQQQQSQQPRSYAYASNSSLSSSSLPPCLIHVIERSSPFSGCDDAMSAGERSIHIVRSPKSGVNFFDLGEFSQQYDLSRLRARSSLEAYSVTLAAGKPSATSSSSSMAGSALGNVVPATALTSTAASSAPAKSVPLVAAAASTPAAPPAAAAAAAAAWRKPAAGMVAASSSGGVPPSPGGSSSTARASVTRAVKDE